MQALCAWPDHLRLGKIKETLCKFGILRLNLVAILSLCDAIIPQQFVNIAKGYVPIASLTIINYQFRCMCL